MRAPNHLALWAGLTALFANLATIEIVVLLGREGDQAASVLASILTAFIVAAGVYSKQRYDDEKAARGDDVDVEP